MSYQMERMQFWSAIYQIALAKELDIAHYDTDAESRKIGEGIACSRARFVADLSMKHFAEVWGEAHGK